MFGVQPGANGLLFAAQCLNEADAIKVLGTANAGQIQSG
jgi:hypothetical protein